MNLRSSRHHKQTRDRLVLLNQQPRHRRISYLPEGDSANANGQGGANLEISYPRGILNGRLLILEVSAAMH